MAVHKVPQDVEADDKLIGFLSMKQFIFVVIAVMLTFAAFQIGRINILLVLPFLPFIFIFGLLGFYQRKDQPAEVYLLAVLGFYLKPHRRIWSQDGIMETVKILVPKKMAHLYSDGLSKTQVKSNLNTLSSLMDTRGWAAKNAVFQTNVVVPTAQIESDRLIAPVQAVPTEASDIHDADDMLDITNNPTAHKFDEMVEQAAQIARQHAVTHMNEPDPSSQIPNYNPYPSQMHQKVMQPVGHQSYTQEDGSTQVTNSQQPNSESLDSSASTMTPPTPDAILELANKRDDNISIETIAKEAQRRMQSLDGDETISLH